MLAVVVVVVVVVAVVHYMIVVAVVVVVLVVVVAVVVDVLIRTGALIAQREVGFKLAFYVHVCAHSLFGAGDTGLMGTTFLTLQRGEFGVRALLPAALIRLLNYRLLGL